MKVMIEGGYQSKFGESWEKSLDELIVEAGEGSLKEAKIKKEEIDLVIIGNKLGGKIENQDQLGARAVELLGLKCPGIRVEAACASGGVAVWQGVNWLKSGRVKKVLVIGAEKMTDEPARRISRLLMGAASEEERLAGLTFVGLYGLMARVYINEYKIGREELARIAVENHLKAMKNPKAQFHKEITLDQVLKANYVAEPLGLFDCSPITDGAAGLVLGVKGGEVEIVSSCLATDSLGLCQRESLTGLTATVKAAKMAYKESGVTPKEIDVWEVHDCFTIAQIMAVEDLGLCEKGKGWKMKMEKINLSGGLKACGHPVGATGVKQVVEIYRQLAGKIEPERKIERARWGGCQNVGGSGATAVVTILKRGEK